MYSGDYGALSVDRQLLAANLHLQQYHHHRMRLQTGSMQPVDWLQGILPTTTTSKSLLTGGDWRSSLRDLQKWRRPGPAVVAADTVNCQPLNLDETTAVNSGGRRRRRDSRDDGRGMTTDRVTSDEPSVTAAAKRRRFDFTRLAESATRRDDSSPSLVSSPPSASDKSYSARVKVVVKHGDCDGGDQSDRRLQQSPVSAAVESSVVDSTSSALRWSLPHRSTASLQGLPLQPLKPSGANPIDRYIPVPSVGFV